MATEVEYQPNAYEEDRGFDEAKYSAVQRQYQVKHITFFRNGDPFFAPKKYIFNEKQVGTWDNLLQNVTDLVHPRHGYVERLYTPRMGHRVQSFEDLRHGEAYVAAAKAERFQSLAYTRIRELPPIRVGGFKKQRIYEGEPGDWRPRNGEMTASAPNNSVNSAPKILHVFRNGDPFYTAQTILLKPQEQAAWSTVLNAISDKVKLLNAKAIRKLYRLDGTRVNQVDQLDNGSHYIAAAREKFKDVRYGVGLPRMHLGTVVKPMLPKFLNRPLTPLNGKTDRRRGWHSDGESTENDMYRQENSNIPRRAIFDDNGFIGKPVRFTKMRSHDPSDLQEDQPYARDRSVQRDERHTGDHDDGREHTHNEHEQEHGEHEQEQGHENEQQHREDGNENASRHDNEQEHENQRSDRERVTSNQRTHYEEDEEEERR